MAQCISCVLAVANNAGSGSIVGYAWAVWYMYLEQAFYRAKELMHARYDCKRNAWGLGCLLQY